MGTEQKLPTPDVQIGEQISEEQSKFETKKPIFIATAEPLLPNELVKFLGTHPSFREHDFDLLVLSADMFTSLHDDYVLRKMSVKEQEQVKNNRINKEYKAVAEEKSAELANILRQFYKTLDEDIAFKQSELKSMLKKTGKDLSHSEVWQIIDLLTNFDLLQVTPETGYLPRTERVYVLTISLDSQLQCLINTKQVLQDEIEIRNIDIKNLNGKITSLKKLMKKKPVKQVKDVEQTNEPTTKQHIE